MIVQHYRSTLEDPSVAEVGQAVYRSGNRARIIGFIWKWDGKIADIILFDPQDLPLDGQEFVSAHVDDATGLHYKLLQRASGSMRAWWKRALAPDFVN
jgi:hypothetical protein